MIEAAMIWNEPNNKSHWDPEIDPEWRGYADMVSRAGNAIFAANPAIARVLGGMSPIDPSWVERMGDLGALDAGLNDKIAEIEAVVPKKPIWVTEVGVSSFGAEEVQQFGIERTAELLIGRVPRIYWYSLFDLPHAWGATTRHKEAEGSSYYRHFYMGLIREDGTPKPALDHYARVADQMGLMQWFHFEDPRLDDAVAIMKRLGVRHLRTGLSWADSFRPGAVEWFDRQMEALVDFEVTLTFCFTPEHLGHAPHHTSAPRDPQGFADFCSWAIDRYAPSVALPARVRG